LFQSARLSAPLSATDFDRLEPAVRTALLSAQRRVIQTGAMSVVVVVAGVDGAGKNDAIARLHEWMDVRYLACNAYEEETDVERARPAMWRYWRDLPARGETSVVVGSWYNEPLRRFVLGDLDEAGFERALARINRFEEMLARENVLLLKVWFSLRPKEQKARLKALKKKARARRILAEWTDLDHSGDAQKAFERAALASSTAAAPWIVIPSEDARSRDIAFGRCLEMAISRRLAVLLPTHPEAASIPGVPPRASALPGAEPSPEPETPEAPAALPASGLDVAAPIVPPVAHVKRVSAVDAIDLTARLPKARYKAELEHWQDELSRLVDKRAFRDLGLVLAFEGNDAAGKGGAIRRLIRPLDPRRYRVHRISAPTGEEKARPYLWRFWTRVPRHGHVAVFDRSWYGRVLVERVEGFCSREDWMRAYGEINAFESELALDGVLVVKLWLAISKEEQLTRFRAREETPYKRFKITDEDWRNRLKWDDYARAAGDMVDRTSTPQAPWALISSEDKRHARVAVIKHVVSRLKSVL
jgi:polyphosphate kinase 2 (PPK2 family)